MTDRPTGTPEPDATGPDAIDAAEPLEADGEAADLQTEPVDADDEDVEDADDEPDDYDEAVREVAGEEVVPAAAAGAASATAKRRGAQPAPSRAPTPSEKAVHVREDVSKFFVIATVVVFTAILLNGLLLGRGGLLNPIPTASPSASAAPSASASAGTSASASPSTSVSASPSSSAPASASAAPSASAPASATPSAAPSASPSP